MRSTIFKSLFVALLLVAPGLLVGCVGAEGPLVAESALSAREDEAAPPRITREVEDRASPVVEDAIQEDATPTVAATTTRRSTATSAATPGLTQAVPPEATATAMSPTATRTPRAALSVVTPSNDNTETGSGGAIVIDHRAVEQFDQIPDEYIQAASELSWLFRHASVGKNISDGLDCLMNNFARRPNFCDRGLEPEQVVFDEKYDRSNWTFELHAPLPSPNPGWWNKVNYFIERVNSLGADEEYDVIGFTFGYVDGNEGSAIDDVFFNNDPNDNFPSVEDVESLEAAHPDKTLVWWTMGLARLSHEESQTFNKQMRDYAVANQKVLMDLADIESHRPDGSPCFDNRDMGIEAICPDYTEEVNAGHLNALGRQRMAKAVWVLMARLAGWEGP